ncbi:unnamed protein product [Prorocentrum cordatum]|uniref:ubiquitinyl hydrolase 1 n=1 Tax=Prorocentrum cordatum TaxID=2364126 RepID=A0ABN9WFL2_9DINO|nr:unnamed protein product [Polarella glacialis]
MIMGAGKSTIIGPLLSLMLADGDRLVMVICPEALLPMSRNCLTGILGSVLARRVYYFSWRRERIQEEKKMDTSSESTPVADKVATVRQTMERAAQDQGCFITTPSCVKTFFLQYVSAMVDAAKVDPALTLPGSELKKQKWGKSLGQVLGWFRERERVSDEMARVLTFWKQKCIAVIDEVDLVLHPLKSELNFPIGNLEPLQPSPQRYTLPMFLLQALVAAANGTKPMDAAKDEESAVAASEILAAVSSGIADSAVQRSPNLVIMSKDWYREKLRLPMGKWALVFLQRYLKGDPELVKHVLKDLQPVCYHLFRKETVDFIVESVHVGQSISDDLSVDRQLSEGNGASDNVATNLREQKHHIDDANRRWDAWWRENKDTLLLYIGAMGSDIEQHRACELVVSWALTDHSKRVLNKCREWICALLVHCLSKRNRIDYGLLIAADAENKVVATVEQASRQVMAVPFTGKDRPSQAAEFASPDVAIGLTYLAYHYEGLRRFMFHILVMLLKEEMKKEPGPFSIRAHWKVFQDWIEEAKNRNHKFEVLSLDLFQPNELEQLSQLQELLKDSPTVRNYLLEKYVFARTAFINPQEEVSQRPGTRAAMMRLSSSSMDLGGKMLFNVRLGFTGTPSEVLPRDFENEKGERCVYEDESDAEIIRTLTSRKCVSVELVKSAHLAGKSNKPGVVWDVESLLQYISERAVAMKWSALIDTGALITGYDNVGVARELMNRGLRDAGVKGVVYLDDQDNQCVVMADGRERVPFATCGLKPNERFTFFDQVHCTGTDIPQVPNAVGVATLGKGMTLRDHAQACWRMRKFGKGQTIVVLAIPEVMTQVEKIKSKLPPEPDEQKGLLRDIMAWLLDAQISSESTQREGLALQQLRDCFRQDAMQRMLASKQPAIFREGDVVKVLPDTSGQRDIFNNPIEPSPDEVKELVILSTERLAEGTVKVHWPDDEEPKEVGLERVSLIDDYNSLRTRFHPEATYLNSELSNRLKHLQAKVFGITKVTLTEDKTADLEAAKEDATEAVKVVDERMDEILRKCILVHREDPKSAVQRTKREMHDLLTKDTIVARNHLVYTYAMKNNINQSKAILKERKKLLNEYCKLSLIGEEDTPNFLFQDEQEAGKTLESSKDPKKPDESENKADVEPPADSIVPEPKALQLLKASPGSPHLLLRASVEAFCEEMSALQVSAKIDLLPRTLDRQLSDLKREYEKLSREEMMGVVNDLVRQAKPKVGPKDCKEGNQSLDSEMCQEQEQEQEKEEQIEGEDEKENRQFMDLPELTQWSASGMYQGSANLMKDRFFPLKDLVPQFASKGGKAVPKLQIETDLLLSSNFAEKELKEDVKDGVSKRRLPNASVLLYLKHGSRGSWIILGLAEAESLRTWILATHQSDRMGLVTTCGQWLTAPVENLTMRPELKDPMLTDGMPPLSTGAPLVFTRFFNCEVHFDELQLVSLVNVLSRNPISAREEWLQAVREGRRRDRKDIKHTVAEQAIHTKDAEALQAIRRGIQVIREDIRTRFGEIEYAFRKLKKEEDDFLDRKDFMDAFSKTSLTQQDSDLQKVYNHVDSSGDGLIELQEIDSSAPSASAGRLSPTAFGCWWRPAAVLRGRPSSETR